MDPNLINTITIWAVIGLVFLVLTMVAFIDAAQKDFGSTPKKAIWAIIALIPFIGWLIYLLFGFRKGSKKIPEDTANSN